MEPRLKDILDADTDAQTILDCLKFARRYGIPRAAFHYGVDANTVRKWRSALAKLCSPNDRRSTKMRVVSCYLHKEIRLAELECQNCGLIVYVPVDQEFDHCPSCCMPISGIVSEGKR